MAHSDARSIGEMISSLRSAADRLAEMQRAGIVLAEDSDIADDYATLVTADPESQNGSNSIRRWAQIMANVA